MINTISWLRSLYSHLHLQHRHQTKHVFRGEIRLAAKFYIIITLSASALWTEALIAAGSEHSEFVMKRQHLFLCRPVRMCCLYLACSSTAQPATGLISTLMPYTHRMSSKLRLFLEQYAQGVSGWAPWPHTHHTPWQKHDSHCAYFTSKLSFIILQSKTSCFYCELTAFYKLF